MFVSRDGTVTGSIDVSKLDEIEPKTDEARALLDALKAEVKSSQETTAAAEQRAAELHEAQAAQFRDDDDGDDRSRSGQTRDAKQQQADAGKSAEQDKQAEAEAKRQQDEAEQAKAAAAQRKQR